MITFRLHYKIRRSRGFFFLQRTRLLVTSLGNKRRKLCTSCCATSDWIRFFNLLCLSHEVMHSDGNCFTLERASIVFWGKRSLYCPDYIINAWTIAECIAYALNVKGHCTVHVGIRDCAIGNYTSWIGDIFQGRVQICWPAWNSAMEFPIQAFSCGAKEIPHVSSPDLRFQDFLIRKRARHRKRNKVKR